MLFKASGWLHSWRWNKLSTLKWILKMVSMTEASSIHDSMINDCYWRTGTRTRTTETLTRSYMQTGTGTRTRNRNGSIATLWMTSPVFDFTIRYGLWVMSLSQSGFRGWEAEENLALMSLAWFDTLMADFQSSLLQIIDSIWPTVGKSIHLTLGETLLGLSLLPEGMRLQKVSELFHWSKKSNLALNSSKERWFWTSGGTWHLCQWCRQASSWRGGQWKISYSPCKLFILHCSLCLLVWIPSVSCLGRSRPEAEFFRDVVSSSKQPDQSFTNCTADTGCQTGVGL